MSREIMKQMTGKQKIEHVFTYYWHYMAGICAITILAVLLCRHMVSVRERPQFTCVLVNQEIDDERDKEVRKRFSAMAGVEEKRIVIDSNYNFSYGPVVLEGANESSYEKFFFQWSVGELDAVVMPESCYRYCRELGGLFHSPAALGWEKPGYMTDNDLAAGIYTGDTVLSPYLRDNEQDRLVVVFPTEGKHEEMSREFIRFLQGGLTGEESEKKMADSAFAGSCGDGNDCRFSAECPNCVGGWRREDGRDIKGLGFF